MGYTNEQILNMLKMYSKAITTNPEKYIYWKDDAQHFAMWYNLADETTKKIADGLYGEAKIDEVLDFADEKNFSDFEKDYNKITNYEEPDQSWKLNAWGCANCYDNAREPIKERLIKKYGKTFIDKVMTYREEMHKKNKEINESQFCKDVPKDIRPIMPLLDNERGILFYSEEKNTLYLFDSMPLKISSSIATKKNIKRENNPLFNEQYELSWQEQNYIFDLEYEYIQATYIPGANKLLLKSTHDQEATTYIAERIQQKNSETIEKLNTKLKTFDSNYFKKKNKDFSETKNYLISKLGIENIKY